MQNLKKCINIVVIVRCVGYGIGQWYYQEILIEDEFERTRTTTHSKRENEWYNGEAKSLRRSCPEKWVEVRNVQVLIRWWYNDGVFSKVSWTEGDLQYMMQKKCMHLNGRKKKAILITMTYRQESRSQFTKDCYYISHGRYSKVILRACPGIGWRKERPV